MLSPAPAAVTSDPQQLVVAHRGASGYLPEHTRASYELAILQGAEWDALAHTAEGTHRMTAKIEELGLKGAIAWFNSPENA